VFSLAPQRLCAGTSPEHLRVDVVWRRRVLACPGEAPGLLEIAIERKAVMNEHGLVPAPPQK